jgi:chemotaxis protein methyltransferase CheR
VGCCTGEEPYSIAILVSRLLPDRSNWRINILGTDINPRFLEKAENGIYTDWSFRDAPSWLKTHYFRERRAGRYEILPAVKSLVRFAYLNLAEDSYPSLLNDTDGMDLILCRNVLMYFAPGRARDVSLRLQRCLADGGWLITSPTEASRELFASLRALSFPAAPIYRKDEERLPSPFIPAPSEMPRTSIHPDIVQTIPVPPLESIGVRTSAAQYYRQPPHIKEKIDPPKHAADGHPKDAMALLAEVREFANRGLLEEALNGCERVIAANKLNPIGHFLKANILEEQNRLEEAAGSLRHTLYLDEGFIVAHVALANLLRQQGRPPEARKAFENALALLAAAEPDAVLAESDGLTAGRLREFIEVHLSTLSWDKQRGAAP